MSCVYNYCTTVAFPFPLLSLLTGTMIYSDYITRNCKIMNPLRASCKNFWPMKWKHLYVYKAHYNAQTRGHTFISRVGFEPITRTFQCPKTVRKSFRAANVYNAGNSTFIMKTFLLKYVSKPRDIATDTAWSVGEIAGLRQHSHPWFRAQHDP